MIKRDRLHTAIKKSDDPQVLAEYKYYRNMVVSEVRKARRELDEKIDKNISHINVSDKRWWQLCKEALGTSSSRLDGPLLDGKRLVSENSVKANLLNDFFCITVHPRYY